MTTCGIVNHGATHEGIKRCSTPFRLASCMVAMLTSMWLHLTAVKINARNMNKLISELKRKG